MLAKVNVDEEAFIAAQFQVRSIPTVYAVFQGQPVADLTNARSESQLKAILDQLLAKFPVGGAAGSEPAQDLAPLLAMGEEVLASGRRRAGGGDLFPDRRDRARQCPGQCRADSRAGHGRAGRRGG